MKWKTSSLQKHWGIFRHVPNAILDGVRLFHVFPVFDGYMTSSLSAILVTEESEVYAIGRNRCMALGTAANPVFQPVNIPELNGLHIEALDTGILHGLALTDNGAVYEWGLDLDKDYSPESPATTRPRHVSWMKTYTILQIACGSFFNLALTSINTICYWGYYDTTQRPMRRLVSLAGEESIKSMTSGLFVSAIIGESGKVYTWTGPKRECWNCSPVLSSPQTTIKIEDVPLGRRMTKKERPLEPRAIKLPVTPEHGKPIKVVFTMRSMYILFDSGHTYVTGYVMKSFRLNSEPDSDLSPSPEVTDRTFGDQFLKIAMSGYPIDIAGCRWTSTLAVDTMNPVQVIVFTDDSRIGSVKNLIEAFTDDPTPQIRSSHLTDSNFEDIHVPTRLKVYKDLFNSERLSDIKFLLADKSIIFAHKCILIAYSNHFAKMLEDGRWKESESDTIDVSHYNPSAYKAYLYFLYNGSLMENLHVVELLEVYHLADEYLECALKKISLYNISKSVIESSTVAELYDWATCNDLKDFADKCVSYGATHLQDVLKSDGFTQLSAERREMFVKELFTQGRPPSSVAS